MSDVKRFTAARMHDGVLITDTVILASDFDARMKQWKEVVRELVKLTNPLIATNYMELQRLRKKALTLLNDQPQEDKP